MLPWCKFSLISLLYSQQFFSVKRKDMHYTLVPVTQFQQNCSILQCQSTQAIAVVDPGGDIEKILAAIDALGNGKVEKILLTHAHIDHVGATTELAKRLNVPIVGPHQGDKFWLDNLPMQAQMFGFKNVEAFEPTQWLDDGDVISVGDAQLEVLHCPGHTPGHVVFYHRPSALAIVGDVLFAGSIGRTDFPQGDHAQLVSSIKNKLFPLGDDIRFIPGHGPMSDFGTERRSNPFVGGQHG